MSVQNPSQHLLDTVDRLTLWMEKVTNEIMLLRERVDILEKANVATKSAPKTN
jgi:hypothetical protein